MAVIVVEDGTIVANANSYVSEANLTTYATDRGLTLVADESILLIKAMDYIESIGYKGVKVLSTQALQWPRYSVYLDGYYFPSNEIPKELKQAQMAVAVSIDQGDDPLATIGQGVKREKVDVLEVEYMPGSSSAPIIKSITSSLWKLLSGGGGGNVLPVVKG